MSKDFKPYLVKGCDKPYNDKDVYPRLEIADLMKDPYQFSLFVQAMANLQAEGYTPVPASWKEMAGIHGVPYSRWSGDPEASLSFKDNGQWGGYCYHSCILFPTWHRVVMLLIEQAVWKEAQAIISKYTYVSESEQKAWEKAAMTLRFPYWDWSDPKVEQEGMPKVFSYERLRILGPGGSALRIRNPLRGYRFESPPDDAPPSNFKGELRVYFDEWTRTYRWATGKNNPTEDYMELDVILKEGTKMDVQTLDGTGMTMKFDPISVNRDKLVRVFSFPTEDKLDQDFYPACWDHFATTGYKSPLPGYEKSVTALESPHNSLHNDIGGSGNMAYLEMAGFDPIFYMHHCTIDRFYALWEYVYPAYWMGMKGYYDDATNQWCPFKDPYGTYQTLKDGEVNEDTYLAPFRKADGEYWTSTEVRGLGPQAYNKHYTYQPLTIEYTTKKDGVTTTVEVTIDVTKSSTADQRALYIAALQYYFGGNKLAAPPKRAVRAPIYKSPVLRSPLANHVPVDGVRDFIVYVSLPQFAFRGSHRLDLYLAGAHVGEVSVFSRLQPEKCKNCKDRMAQGIDRVQGIVGLPNDLVVHVLQAEDVNKEDSSDDDVANAIRKHLVGRLVRPNKTLLAHAEFEFGKREPDDETTWTKFAVSAETDHRLVTVDNRIPISAVNHPVLDNKHRPTMELYSASVLIGKEGRAPLEHADWKSHGSVFDEDWRRWTAPEEARDEN